MKTLIGFLGLFLLSGCTDFPSRYENIEGNKTRPFTIICDPAEAAPGDTVTVRLFCYYPAGRAIRWSLFPDYRIDLYGNENDGAVEIDLQAASDSFQFVVPAWTIARSTYANTVLRPLLDSMAGLSVAEADTMLKTLPSLPPELIPLADQFSTRIKVQAVIESDIHLRVFKYLTVRYSRKFASPSVNLNPEIRWIGVTTVYHKGVTDPDSIRNFPHSVQYLYYPDSLHLLNDTVTVDVDRSYFMVADSGINGADTTRQHYTYYSFRTGALKTDLEEYFYDWFYTNLDYGPPMKMDSLFVFSGDRSEAAVPFLPPVDTKMGRARIYLVVRDFRPDDPTVSTGCAYRETLLHFRYSDAYRRAHP